MKSFFAPAYSLKQPFRAAQDSSTFRDGNEAQYQGILPTEFEQGLPAYISRYWPPQPAQRCVHANDVPGLRLALQSAGTTATPLRRRLKCQRLLMPLRSE